MRGGTCCLYCGILFAYTTDEVLCNPTPLSKNATLPAGCVIDGTTNNVVGVVECVPRPCLRNDTWLSNTTCKDETLCCGVEEVDVTVSCGSSVTFSVSRVRPISSKTSTKIRASPKRAPKRSGSNRL